MTREVIISVQGTHKIEVLTLTTKLEIIMTIEIQILSTPDISVDNEVINLHRTHTSAGGVLSAASFLVAGSSRDSLVFVLDFICEIITKKIPEYEVWLFLGNSAWQPDTRIVRYRKLWEALKSRGLEILGGSRSQEIVVEADGKLKFFGALRLSEQSVGTVVNALLDERCSYIAALPKEFDIQSALEVGWSGGVTGDSDFLYHVCESEGLLFKRVGEFDDCDKGFVSIGLPGLIEQLSNPR
jgi:hypothetical protein